MSRSSLRDSTSSLKPPMVDVLLWFSSRASPSSFCRDVSCRRWLRIVSSLSARAFLNACSCWINSSLRDSLSWAKRCLSSEVAESAACRASRMALSVLPLWASSNSNLLALSLAAAEAASAAATSTAFSWAVCMAESAAFLSSMSSLSLLESFSAISFFTL